MTTMAKTLKLLHLALFCVAIGLMTGCGGGSSGSPSSVTTYDVGATAGTGGNISPSSAMVNGGGTTSFSVTSSTGYAISSVTGCGGTLSGNTYTTGMINANCSVTASFVPQYAVTATAGAGGTISPSSSTVSAGSTTTFTVTATKSGYGASVTGCGGTLSGNTYTTGPINAACTVTASFGPAFTWVSGSNSVNAKGVFGTQGVAAAANAPGARYDAVRWTDANGNIWLFGGYGGYDSVGNITWSNDLWKYSPSSGEWTWVSGPQAGGAGVYGAKGIATAGSIPGARSGAAGWIDASGNLWLFGGYGFDSAGQGGYMNDLWQYSPTSGLWTWSGGSNTNGNATGVYGTRGMAAASNVPGGRDNAARWMDASGNFWLFGGAGNTSTIGEALLNDLWEYSPSSNQWTWVGGSSGTVATAVYGTKGMAAAANVPGGRYRAASWTDANGNFLLFGGQGNDSTNLIGWLNDMWEYSPSSGQWTWVSGSNVQGVTGVYGAKGVAAASNMPGGRAGAVVWTDASGNLWLYGGQATSINWAGDLWEYSPPSGEWTWIGGSSSLDAPAVYGTLGAPAISNMPGARADAIGWTDASGNLWLFGGFKNDSTGTSVNLNDLWKYPTQ